MQLITLVLACLACSNHGRRIQASVEEPVKVSTLDSLAALLMDFNAAPLESRSHLGNRLPRGSPSMGVSILSFEEKKKTVDAIKGATDIKVFQTPEFERLVFKHRRYLKMTKIKAKELGQELPEGYGDQWQRGMRREEFINKVYNAKTVEEVTGPDMEKFMMGSGKRLYASMRKLVEFQVLKLGGTLSKDWAYKADPKGECLALLKEATKAKDRKMLAEAVAKAEELEFDPEEIEELSAAQEIKTELDEKFEAIESAAEALKTSTEGDDLEALEAAIEKAEELEITKGVDAAKKRKDVLVKEKAKAEKEAAADACMEELKTAMEGTDPEAIKAVLIKAEEMGLNRPEMKEGVKKQAQLEVEKLEAEKKAAEEAKTDE